MAVVYIDIEHPTTGAKQGSGPILSAEFWRCTAKMDRAGTFEFQMPASDGKALTVRKKYIARAYALLNGQRVEVGAGIIDQIQKQPAQDGKVALRVSGGDLIRELTYRSVRKLKLYTGGNPVSHATAVAAVGAYAPAGWTFTPDGAPPNDSVYGYFNGESVLAGMVKVGEKSQNHFYRGDGRSLIFTSTFTSSGVRAIQARGELAPETCAIVSLTEQIDTYDLMTRIYPKGSGNANVQLTLRATTRVAPTGFTLNATSGYIEHDASVATYGVIEREVDYREIGPVDNTDADIVAASNALFDAAIETLRRRSTELEQATYTLQVAGCSQLLRPMQSIRLVYRDTAAGLNLNNELNILEATWQVDRTGIHTTGLKVSNADRWPESDVGTIADGIEQGHVYQALQQLNANSYVVAYTKNVDHEEIAEFRFRFGNEVTQLQQVLFEFQLLPFESTVKSVAGVTGTSGGGGSSVESASSGGSHTHSVTVPAHSHTVTIAAHAHTVTVAGHSHTVTIAAHSHTVTVAGHNHTVTISNHDHDIPDHQHETTVAGGSGGTALTLSEPGGGLGFLTKASAGDVKINSNSDSGSTTSNDGGGQSVSSSTLSDTTPSSSSGGGQTPSSSVLADATPSSSTLAQTTPASNVQSQSVETSSSNGNHTHAVTIPTHTHTLTPVIEMIYGIFRADADDTYEASELEYRVNGGSWVDADTAADAGDGWLQLDITSLVYSSTTFRPLQANNLVEIQAKAANAIALDGWSRISNVTLVGTLAAHGLQVGDNIVISGAALGVGSGTDINGSYIVTDVPVPTLFNIATVGVDDGNTANQGTVLHLKTATIDAQLSVRNIIQAVAYLA